MKSLAYDRQKNKKKGKAREEEKKHCLAGQRISRVSWFSKGMFEPENTRQCTEASEVLTRDCDNE